MIAHPTKPAVLAFALLVGALAACNDNSGGTGPQPLPSPTGVSTSQLSLNAIRVSWSGVTGASSYLLQRASAASPGVFAQMGGGLLAATTFDDNTVSAGVAYSYRVAAVGGADTSAFSALVTFTTGLQQGVISADITANRTLFSDTAYVLSGYIKVKNGATLTIQPGTKIVGDTNVAGSSLWILRGSKIDASGTAGQPIVFTSQRSAGNRKPGDWGGIVIIGNGIMNRTGATILT
ncbi:MAG: hypothetical protein ACREMF_04010, partial [Gemmatimonadales bacterium]